MSLVLNESLVLAKTRSQDLKSVIKLNCWGSGIKDVSLLRQMANVEVVGLSCNEITTLEDFAYCPKLKELILRKNKIKNISEVAHLQGLSKLTSLWLGENPCAENTHNYRKVVLRALPNLTVLDNQPVTKEELQEIEELGNEIYEEIPYDSVNSSSSGHSSAPKSQHQNVDSNDTHESHEAAATATATDQNTNETSYYQPSESHDSSNMIQLNDSHYTTSNRTPMRNSRGLPNQGTTSMGWSNNNNNNNLLPKGGKSRSANILSAVLCLVKELDYVSCEVVQTALHCRMEETLS